MGLNVPLDLLVVEKPPCDVIIGLPPLEALQALLNYESQTVTLRHNNETIKVAFEHNAGQKLQTIAGADSKDITLDVDSECSSEESNCEAFFQDILSVEKSGYNLDSIH